MYSRGFTLIELLTTLTIMALLLTIGLPSFSAQIHNTRLTTTTHSLFEAIQLARSQAVFSNKRAVIKHNSRWEDGWEVFMDGNNNGLKDDNETIVMKSEKTMDVRITANRPLQNYISFIGTGESRYVGRENGGAFQAGTFKVCPAEAGSGYTLILSRSGRMRMNEITKEECATR